MSRKSIALAEEWTYRTPLVTRTYPPGKHSVDEEVHEAAVKAGVTKENDNGDRTAKTGPAGDPDPAES